MHNKEKSKVTPMCKHHTMNVVEVKGELHAFLI